MSQFHAHMSLFLIKKFSLLLLTFSWNDKINLLFFPNALNMSTSDISNYQLVFMKKKAIIFYKESFF